MRNWLLMILMSVAVFAFGGCSGSSSGGHNPTPTPTPEPTPEVKTEFIELEGIWEMSSGSGTATGTDGKYNLSLISAPNGGAMRLINVAPDDNTATFTAAAYTEWLAKREDGNYSAKIILDHRTPNPVTVTRENKNTFSYKMPGTDTVIRLVAQSANVGTVTETGKFTVTNPSGTYTYDYSGTYTLTRIQ